MKEDNNKEKLFFSLLSYSLWSIPFDELLLHKNNDKWCSLFHLSQKQALLGIILDAITKLPPSHHPPLQLKLKWIAILQKIETQNEHLNRYALEVSNYFSEQGFKNLILKGQGIATYYPNPAHRQSGDIDIYLEGEREDLIKHAQKLGDIHEVIYHHIDLSTPKGEVELHTHCSFYFDPFRNRKLQRKLKAWTKESFDTSYVLINGEKLPVPNPEMNQFYILFHIYRHLFSEGIGLRQLCDYAMLMDKTYTEKLSLKLRKNLKEFGLIQFAEGVFYVLVNYLGYPKDKLPLPINDDKFGKFLFREIMQAGNFGQYDERVTKKDNESNIQKMIRIMKRNIMFLSYFPREVLFTPYFKVWHWVWRKHKGYL